MTVKYAPRIYAPFYKCPPEPGSPAVSSYEDMKNRAGRISGYLRVGIAPEVAMALAVQSPYPDGVKTGVRKLLANADGTGVTLEQLRIMLGWAARRAQHTGR